MTPPSKRLAELGLQLPAVTPPVADYVPAVRVRDIVYTSGQLPFVDGKMEHTGLVGTGAENVSPEQAKDSARTAVLNAVAAAADLAGGVDNIEQVIKVTGFVASSVSNAAERFTGQPGVINGASELLGEIFGDSGSHARSAVGVAALPLDAPVEVELIVKVRPGN